MNTAVETLRPRRGAASIWIPRLICLLLVGGAAGGVAWIARMPAPARDAAPVERPPTNVRVVELSAIAELPDALELTAVVEPRMIVRVAAEVASRVESIGLRERAWVYHGADYPAGEPLDEGQPVQAGDLLVVLNSDRFTALYERALAQFEWEEREFRRVQGLYERSATSLTELDDARSRRDIAKAALDEVSADLERCKIAAPISGVLNKLPREVGEYVNVGDPVAELVDLDQAAVVVDVPERDIRFMQLGASAAVSSLGAAPPLTGVVTYIDAVANSETRTTRLELTVDNSSGALRSGQIVRVRLVRRVLRDVLMIPLAAVIPLEQGHEVYLVEGGVAARRPVELGLIRGRDVQVLGGLRAGDVVIVDGHRFVGPGQAVRVIRDEPQ